jgi:hypothetical protein
MPRSPMPGRGMSTRMETQEPVEPFWVDPVDPADAAPGAPPATIDMEAVGRRAYRAERLDREATKYQRLVEELSGGGGAVLQHVGLLLAQRIQALVEHDPEAKAYLAVLQQTAGALAVGKRYAEMELAALFEEGARLDEDSLRP